jgi:hypothetical protein
MRVVCCRKSRWCSSEDSGENVSEKVPPPQSRWGILAKYMHKCADFFAKRQVNKQSFVSMSDENAGFSNQNLKKFLGVISPHPLGGCGDPFPAPHPSTIFDCVWWHLQAPRIQLVLLRQFLNTPLFVYYFTKQWTRYIQQNIENFT